MLKRTLLAAFVAIGGSVAVAGPKEDVTAAAKKLADAANYTWSSKVEGGMGGGETQVKTQKDGLTWVSMQMRDNTVEAAMKGDKVVIKTEDGWLTPEEASQGDAGGGPNVGRFAGRVLSNMKSPAVQAQEWVEKIPDLKATEDGYTGELSGDDAKAMLQRRGGGRGPGGPGGGPGGAGGGPAGPGGPGGAGAGPGGPGGPGGAAPEVKDAKATFTFRTKDGVLSRVVYTVTGTVHVRDEDRDINRTTTIDITDVGTTNVAVPDEAKAKLAK